MVLKLPPDQGYPWLPKVLNTLARGVFIKICISPMPIRAPGTLLTRNIPERAINPALFPMAGPISQAMMAAPNMPVPKGSARAAHGFLKSLKASPAAIAPGMLPGKAKIVPVPAIIRRRLVENAAEAAHQGPKAAPARTFAVCWKG